MAEPVLELRGVAKTYGTRVRTEVLHAVDLAVRPGEFAALVGPSGSGKSTLLNVLGLLDRPTAGRVLVRGRDTTTMDDAARTATRAGALGFVFQSHHLIAALTAVENVMVPLALVRGRIGGAAMRARAAAVLGRVGLGERLDHRASDLSGGEQQRVAIARALAADPPLVLADEPTGNLDTRAADRVFTLMREFNRERGTAFLIVTHDPRLAARCDREVRLVDGRIVGDRAVVAAG